MKVLPIQFMLRVKQQNLPKILSIIGFLLIAIVIGMTVTKNNVLGYDNSINMLTIGIILITSGILWFLFRREYHRPDPIEEKIKMLSAEQQLELSKRIFTYISMTLYVVAVVGISPLYHNSFFTTENSLTSFVPIDIKISIIIVKTILALTAATLLLWKKSKMGSILAHAAWGFLMLDLAFVQTFDIGSITGILYYLAPGWLLPSLYRFRKYLK